MAAANSPASAGREWHALLDKAGNVTGQVSLEVRLTKKEEEANQSASPPEAAASLVGAGDVTGDVTEDVMLLIRAGAGRALKAMDRGGTSDPYITFHVGTGDAKSKQKERDAGQCKTRVVKKNCNPSFDQDLELRVTALQLSRDVLTVQVPVRLASERKGAREGEREGGREGEREGGREKEREGVY